MESILRHSSQSILAGTSTCLVIGIAPRIVAGEGAPGRTYVRHNLYIAGHEGRPKGKGSEMTDSKPMGTRSDGTHIHHGTQGGYTLHVLRHEVACGPCKEASRAKAAEFFARRAAS